MTKNPSGKIIYKSYNPFSQFAIVEEIWTSMLEKCPHPYFLSWAWTEIWIKSLPEDCNLSLVAGFHSDSPVIAFFLGAKKRTKYSVFNSNHLSLNETLISYIDAATYIEYNAILIDPEITISLESLLEQLPANSWDQFRMTRWSSKFQPNLVLNSHLNKKYELYIENLESYYVDLEKVRRNNNDYLSLLKPKRQKQIRRSITEYEKMGEIKVHVAVTVEEALNIYEKYLELQQKRCKDLGYRSTMATDYAIDFHIKLISERFNHGEIQMIKISAGDHTIGCVYDIIFNREVLGISCGFNYLPGNVFMPGFVCHYYVVTYNAKIGMRSYDWLAEGGEYKSKLCTDLNEMQTINIHKKGVKNTIENIADNSYSLYKKFVS